MILSHRIQLKPTKQQLVYLVKACGTARFTWNWALATWQSQYASGLKPNSRSLQAQFNKIKYQQFPWLKEIHRDAHARPFTNLWKAFKRFFSKKARHPKFKKKGTHDSFYVSNDRFWVRGNIIRLPVLGTVKATETLRLQGKIMGAVVSRSADRWFISISVDVGDLKKQRISDNTLGVDVGLKTAVVTSDGQTFQFPKPLKSYLKKLQRASRRHSRKVAGSQNRRKEARKLAKIYWRAANSRKDFLHKISTKLCRENQAVVIEDLDVENMMRNKNFSSAICDASWSELRRQLEYKSKLYDAKLIVAPQFYPSSKTCSSCGAVRKDLTLAERVFRCRSCGLTIDRDLNAAKNLCTLGLRGTDACGHSTSTGSSEELPASWVGEAGTKPCALVSTY